VSVTSPWICYSKLLHHYEQYCYSTMHFSLSHLHDQEQNAWMDWSSTNPEDLIRCLTDFRLFSDIKISISVPLCIHFQYYFPSISRSLFWKRWGRSSATGLRLTAALYSIASGTAPIPNGSHLHSCSAIRGAIRERSRRYSDPMRAEDESRPGWWAVQHQSLFTCE
jgi:hypothetical protein